MNSTLQLSSRVGLNGRYEYEFVDTAPQSCACPQCGERNIDKLALDPDDIVTCLVCNTEYDISPAARLERVTLGDLGIEPFALSTVGMEMAGAFSPRCD